MADNNPFLFGAAQGSGKPKPNPFLLSTPSSSAAKPNPFLIGPGGGGKSEDLPVLEQTAEQVGAPTVAQDSPGFWRTAADLLSRPNYAAAGAAEELFSPKGGGAEAALKRAGTELFSGIGGLKGQKEGFGQVMEQAGVGEGGKLSDILGPLYNETGKGWRLQKGGALDFTGRGAAGLTLDIVVDPLNLVNPAAIARKVIPTAVADATKATLKAIPAYERTIDTIGAIFNRDWKIRNLPGAIALKNAHLARQNHETAQLFDALGKSQVAAIPKSERAAFIDAMDQGTWADKYRNNPKMLQTADEFKKFNDGFAVLDMQNGSLDPDRVRENYVAHFYENSPKELSKVISLWPGAAKYAGSNGIGRHAEFRAFDTLAEAEKWSKAQHAIDPAVPILRPLRDPLEILRRRGVATIESGEWKQYSQELVDRYGRQPFDASKAFDLTKEIPVHPVEAAHITELVAKGKTPIEEFGRLTRDGKQEFLRQRLLKATEPAEIIASLDKYGVEHAPQQISTLGTLAEDGTPYKMFNTGREKVELPESMIDDLKDMSSRLLDSRELDYTLKWFDKTNNVFKSFVTVGFPAFHFRNSYSNVAQGFADIGIGMLNPARHFDAVSSLRGLDGDLITKTGEHIPYKQLQDEMARNGVTTTGRQIAEYTGEQGVERLSTVAGKIKAAPRAFGGAIENEARATLYTIYRRRGMEVGEAAARVNKVLFDYTDLSTVEQNFFRRAIPFYTWQKKNIAQQFRNLATKPGLTAAEIKPFRGREDENASMASWDSEALKFRINRDGKTLRVLSGIDLPVKNLDQLWNGTWQSTLRQNIGMLSPAIKAPLEMGFGVNAFTGKEFGRTESNLIGRAVEHAPKALQHSIGYDKTTDSAGRSHYTFDGQRFYALFQSWALSRVVSTTDRQFRVYSEDPDWSKIMLNTLTGMQDKTFNLDEEQAKRMKERTRQLEENLIRWGKRREFQRVYKPK